ERKEFRTIGTTDYIDKHTKLIAQTLSHVRSAPQNFAHYQKTACDLLFFFTVVVLRLSHLGATPTLRLKARRRVLTSLAKRREGGSDEFARSVIRVTGSQSRSAVDFRTRLNGLKRGLNGLTSRTSPSTVCR
ncbi:MAG: hypothetical protein AAGF51_11900, partial [Pseudomonadota bacterium]